MAGGSLEIEDAVRIVREAAGALQSVHGELWPSAILVEGNDVRVEPPTATDRLRYGQYAAPERVLGKPATPQSDVFSLGAILYHAVAGRPPFRGDSPAAVMLSICTDQALDAPPDVPPSVAALIRRCLMRDPAERFASPAVLRDA
ncbi:MAG: eukaryotic-like serine/threonine-protein kinase, partial [Acidobacteriota bacterium]|nr:eukaryotic-like serine/threonine-protein kinase [Acidobacteriota bacterium]